MKKPLPRATSAGLFLLLASAACGGMTHPATPAAPASSAAVPASAPGPNAADVEFMSGMIPHHAQAVIMAGWAPTHGARKDVAILCERIVVGQRDEIAMMQTWLRDRGQPVPDAKSTRTR